MSSPTQKSSTPSPNIRYCRRVVALVLIALAQQLSVGRAVALFGVVCHRTHASGTTATYVKANLHEITAALTALTQEPTHYSPPNPNPTTLTTTVPVAHNTRPAPQWTTFRSMIPPMPQPI
ncbi:hypothetical protein ACIBG0_22805 [Nocardia sp. NPDC050630]|uniref:hypothetical protein n=1 Tax=Nocardia sp. NPDC050630 TaxID=3364321 RepID=UPI0037BD2922